LAPVTVTLDPGELDAVLFDLDGVVTDTASVHAAAWTRLFDDYLAHRSARPGEDLRPFTPEDYLRHVDGMPRADGVRRFLASRGIELPNGEPGDGPDAETANGLGNRKDRLFAERLAADGVEAFDSTVELVLALRAAGFGVAVFSASRNCRAVLEAAGLGDLFPVRVDGVVAAELGLPGKPDPAVLLEAANRLGADPARTAVVEDAEAGVEAGRRGSFALVIGVDRGGDRERLAASGADVVVADLAEVEVAPAGRAAR
jgi:alpha,alpha-trehalase